MSEWQYSIDSENAVRIWDSTRDAEVPNFLQPNYPDGTEWTSEEAEMWALLKIEEIENDDAPFAPTGRGLLGQPKPTPEQIREMKLSQLGLTVDDLKAMLGLQ